MSDMERHMGKVRRVTFSKKESVVFAQRLAEVNGWGPEKYDDSFIPVVCDELYEKYIYFRSNGSFYEIVESEEKEPYDFYEAERLNDDLISFHVYFYNGGCCLGEAIEASIKRLNKKAENETTSD